MKIVERQVGDVIILDLHGKILIGEGDDALRDAVTKLVDGGKTKILLNLADVPYVDSAGLGEIVRCYTTVSRKNGNRSRSRRRLLSGRRRSFRRTAMRRRTSPTAPAQLALSFDMPPVPAEPHPHRCGGT